MISNGDKFLRLTGVLRFIFDEIVQALKDFEKKKFKARERPPRLIVEDQVLLLLKLSTSRLVNFLNPEIFTHPLQKGGLFWI